GHDTSVAVAHLKRYAALDQARTGLQIQTQGLDWGARRVLDRKLGTAFHPTIALFVLSLQRAPAIPETQPHLGRSDIQIGRHDIFFRPERKPSGRWRLFVEAIGLSRIVSPAVRFTIRA